MSAGIACAVPAPYPVTINSRAQTAPPVVVYRGNESVYRLSFTDGDVASVIAAGEIPFMSWATNNAAAVNSTSSYAVVAGTTGVVDFTFSPASVNFTPGAYIYEAGVKSVTGNNRVYRQGKFQIYGSPVGSGVAAVTWATNMNWASFTWQNLPVWLLASNTNGWQVGAHSAWITNETDAIALAALATNKVVRWYEPIPEPHNWAEWDGMTNIVIYREAVSGTNFVVTLSENFADITISPTKPEWDTYVFPFVWSETWTGTMSSDDPAQLVLTGIDSALWTGTASSYPVNLLPANAGAQGTATVSIASFVYSTNVEYRYYLPTNAIPPELTNLDQLQGWLNNLYAGKGDFTNHTSTASIHVPIFIGTTNALPLLANRTNGVLYVEIP